MNQVNKRIESNTSYINNLFLNIKKCLNCGVKFIGSSKLCKGCNRDSKIDQII